MCCAYSAERKERCFFMEQKKWWQKKGLWISLVALVLVAAGALWAWKALSPKPTEGAKTIAVEVVHKDESKKQFDG